MRFLSSPLFSLFWLLINSRAPLPLSLFHSCYSHPLIHWRMSDPPSNPTHSPSTTPIPSSTSPHNANLFSASQLLNDGPPPRPQLPIELDGSSPRAHGLYYHLNLLLFHTATSFENYSNLPLYLKNKIQSTILHYTHLLCQVISICLLSPVEGQQQHSSSLWLPS